MKIQNLLFNYAGKGFGSIRKIITYKENRVSISICVQCTKLQIFLIEKMDTLCSFYWQSQFDRSLHEYAFDAFAL